MGAEVERHSRQAWRVPVGGAGYRTGTATMMQSSLLSQQPASTRSRQSRTYVSRARLAAPPPLPAVPSPPPAVRPRPMDWGLASTVFQPSLARAPKYSGQQTELVYKQRVAMVARGPRTVFGRPQPWLGPMQSPVHTASNGQDPTSQKCAAPGRQGQVFDVSDVGRQRHLRSLHPHLLPQQPLARLVSLKGGSIRCLGMRQDKTICSGPWRRRRSSPSGGSPNQQTLTLPPALSFSCSLKGGKTDMHRQRSTGYHRQRGLTE